MNPVRHYDVSQWLLDNYAPWIGFDGEVLYLRNDITPPDPGRLAARLRGDMLTDDALSSRLPPCA